MMEIRKLITSMDSEISELDRQIGLLTEKYNLYVSLLNDEQMDEVSFTEQSTKTEREISKLRARRNKLLNEDEDERSIDELRTLRRTLLEFPAAIIEFDFKIFNAVIDKVIVENESTVIFVLLSGLQLKEEIAWN